METADTGLGRQAIKRALGELYPGRAPDQHWGTLISYRLGGPDPLEGVSAWLRDDHVHYLTWGFSELDQKSSGDRQISGYGFELTYRPAGRSPSVDVAALLQTLARYVFQSGNLFKPGDWIDYGHPLAEGSALVGFTIVEDPELPPILTPFGRVAFLQLVGLTHAELERCAAREETEVIARLGATSALLVTDPARAHAAPPADAPKARPRAKPKKQAPAAKKKAKPAAKKAAAKKKPAVKQPVAKKKPAKKPKQPPAKPTRGPALKPAARKARAGQKQKPRR